jgi:hypothetical protein
MTDTVQVLVRLTDRETAEGQMSWLVGNGFQPIRKLTPEELKEFVRTGELWIVGHPGEVK